MDNLGIKNMNKTSKKLIHGGDITSAREELGRLDNPPGILDFSANVNPLGLPEGVKRAIRESIDTFDIYPDPLCRELVSALSRHEAVSAEWVLCGNGAADLIYRTVHAVKPKKAMVLAPTFAEYEEALNTADCRVVPYPLKEENGFRSDERLLDALESGLDMLFLCNPNNPTGQLMTKDFLLIILRRCQSLGILLFMDECFNDFLENPEGYTTKDFLKDFDNLVILKAFTKIYAMAGLRLGHCISSDTGLLERIRAAGQPWSVSSPAQLAGIRAVEEKNYLARTKELIRAERGYLIPALENFGITVIGSNANYIFVKDPRISEKPLHQMLFEKGILIRNCDNYRGLGPGFYRICIRRHEDNVKLVEALKAVRG